MRTHRGHTPLPARLGWASVGPGPGLSALSTHGRCPWPPQPARGWSQAGCGRTGHGCTGRSEVREASPSPEWPRLLMVTGRRGAWTEEPRGAWLWPPPTSIPDQPPWSWRLLLAAFSTARHVGTRPERRRPQPPPRSTCCPRCVPGAASRSTPPQLSQVQPPPAARSEPPPVPCRPASTSSLALQSCTLRPAGPPCGNCSDVA